MLMDVNEIKQPQVIVIAGPNGAGKTTTARDILQGPFQVDQFVNADIIAQGLSGFAPEAAAIPAGRIMLERVRELASERRSFAFETTLASRSFAPWLASLVQSGYEFHLNFIWLPNAEMAVARVADRVRNGGHHVPEETVRRRYLAGIKNFVHLYSPLAASWQVVNNTTRECVVIAYGSKAEVTVERSADWAAFMRSSNP